jgi:hypothetical protein
MSNIAAVNPAIKPGLYLDIPNESYHAGPGISKSGLWTIATKTPAHLKFGADGHPQRLSGHSHPTTPQRYL